MEEGSYCADGRGARLAPTEVSLWRLCSHPCLWQDVGIVARRWRVRRGRATAEARKHLAELDFWRHESDVYVRWLRGKIPHLYGIPPPRRSDVVRASSLKLSAILTWIRCDGDKYLRHLRVSPDLFQGKSVLEVGCGPLPYSLAFTDCRLTGLDPLVASYKEAGYPLGSYDKRLRYVAGAAERMPLRARAFDAVISVNAIDHVDDFWIAAREIDRVLADDGLLLLEVHYHPPTTEEPWTLSDETIRRAFEGRGLVKVSDIPFTDMYWMYRERQGERLTVWTNRPEIVKGTSDNLQGRLVPGA